MDVELARTFLAVVETGSFLAAAERVHVTQSTVSTRIKSLEDQLRRPLFTRSKTGAELTTAGRHFHRHAQTILRSWTQARLDVGLPEHLEAVIDIGAQHSLWDGYLSTALGALHLAFPELAFKASMADSEVTSATTAILPGCASANASASTPPQCATAKRGHNTPIAPTN
mgnify:CR=1 FL=1